MSKIIEYVKIFFTSNTKLALSQVKNNVTGFKSACVYFCYSAFFYIIKLCVFATTVLIIVGGVNKEFAVALPVLKDIYIPTITVSATLLGVAISCVFGASYVSYKDGQVNGKNDKKEEIQQ